MWWTIQWRHNERDGVPNHQPHDCLLDRLFKRRSRKHQSSASLAFVRENSPLTGEFPTQMASNEGHFSIWWRHHDFCQMGNWQQKESVVYICFLIIKSGCENAKSNAFKSNHVAHQWFSVCFPLDTSPKPVQLSVQFSQESEVFLLSWNRHATYATLYLIYKQYLLWLAWHTFHISWRNN